MATVPASRIGWPAAFWTGGHSRDKDPSRAPCGSICGSASSGAGTVPSVTSAYACQSPPTADYVLPPRPAQPRSHHCPGHCSELPPTLPPRFRSGLLRHVQQPPSIHVRQTCCCASCGGAPGPLWPGVMATPSVLVVRQAVQLAVAVRHVQQPARSLPDGRGTAAVALVPANPNMERATGCNRLPTTWLRHGCFRRSPTGPQCLTGTPSAATGRLPGLPLTSARRRQRPPAPAPSAPCFPAAPPHWTGWPQW